MTQKDKELLLKDLCARLPYGVIINVHDTFPCTTLPYFNMRLDSFVSILSSIEPIFKTKDRLIKRILKEHTEYLEFKPYLRPMSSMTVGERDEMKQLLNPDGTGWFTTEGFIIPASHYGDVLDYSFLNGIRDYLDSKHFDHRGLIPKGLALEVPEGMYNIKEK